MTDFIALFFICIAAIAAIAAAVRFFWRESLARCVGIGVFVVSVFLVFWLSGLWEGASRHSWGQLTPAFAIIMCLGALAVSIGLRLVSHYAAKKKNKPK